MLRDVPSRRHPYPFLLGDVLAEVAQGFAAAGFAGNAAVEGDIHHLDGMLELRGVDCEEELEVYLAAFTIQAVERALEILLV